MPALLTSELTRRRDNIAGFVGHLAFSDDPTTQSASQNTVNPGAGSTVVVRKNATTTTPAANVVVTTASVDGSVDTPLVGKRIFTVSRCAGNAASAGAPIDRNVDPSTLGFGLTSTRAITVAVEESLVDATP